MAEEKATRRSSSYGRAKVSGADADILSNIRALVAQDAGHWALAAVYCATFGGIMLHAAVVL